MPIIAIPAALVNRKIAQTEQSAELASLQRQLADARQQAEQEIADFTAQMKANKQRREAVRASNPTDETLAQLVRESQFEKAELRRTKMRLNEGIARLQQQIDGIHNRLRSLKTERKQRSAALQRRLFDCFQVLNAHGEQRGICSIFETFCSSSLSSCNGSFHAFSASALYSMAAASPYFPSCT